MNVSKSALVILALPLAIIIIVLTYFGVQEMLGRYDALRYAKARPPESIVDLDGFLEWKPDIHASYAVSVRGVTYYVLQGDLERRMGSYRAEYTFDYKGNFVDWTIDAWSFDHPRIVYSQIAERATMSLGRIQALVSAEELPTTSGGGR